MRGLFFKEQEAGYLVGYLAGLQAKNVPNGSGVIAAVGGLKIPPVDRFIAGYYVGAKKAFPAVKVEHSYSQDFVDQAKCKEAALNHIANGATVVFAVAGQCGLGVLSAAKERNVFAIGVDADQGYLGNHVLTSATKQVNVAVFETVKAAKLSGAKFRTNRTSPSPSRTVVSATARSPRGRSPRGRRRSSWSGSRSHPEDQGHGAGPAGIRLGNRVYRKGRVRSRPFRYDFLA